MTAPKTITANMLEFDMSDRMRKALKVSGLSVGDMAEYLGVKPETCSRYINGKAKPPLQTLRLWALRTGVPFGWLQTGENPHPDGPDGGNFGNTMRARRDSNPQPSDVESTGLRAGVIQYPSLPRQPWKSMPAVAA